MRRLGLAVFLLSLTALSLRAEARRWALAIHGGAGSLPSKRTPAKALAIEEALARALGRGKGLLQLGKPALHVVEQVVRVLEDEPLFNAGKGAVFTHAGQHELDASIMDGRTLSCGAVAGVRTVKNPVSLARLVMEKTPHVLLTGKGVHEFAEEMGVELVEQDYFFVKSRHDWWKKVRAGKAGTRWKKGTVGCVAIDVDGHLAAATSTGGLTDKRWGRVGDSPVIGAGTYANDESAAVSCTGTGEEFIRHGVARDIAARLSYKGLALGDAAREVVHDVLQPGDGGIIAVDGEGNLALVFNTEAMARGWATSQGVFEVRAGE